MNNNKNDNFFKHPCEDDIKKLLTRLSEKKREKQTNKQMPPDNKVSLKTDLESSLNKPNNSKFNDPSNDPFKPPGLPTRSKPILPKSTVNIEFINEEPEIKPISQTSIEFLNPPTKKILLGPKDLEEKEGEFNDKDILKYTLDDEFRLNDRDKTTINLDFLIPTIDKISDSNEVNCKALFDKLIKTIEASFFLKFEDTQFLDKFYSLYFPDLIDNCDENLKKEITPLMDKFIKDVGTLKAYELKSNTNLLDLLKLFVKDFKNIKVVKNQFNFVQPITNTSSHSSLNTSPAYQILPTKKDSNSLNFVLADRYKDLVDQESINCPKLFIKFKTILLDILDKVYLKEERKILNEFISYVKRSTNFDQQKEKDLGQHLCDKLNNKIAELSTIYEPVLNSKKTLLLQQLSNDELILEIIDLFKYQEKQSNINTIWRDNLKHIDGRPSTYSQSFGIRKKSLKKSRKIFKKNKKRSLKKKQKKRSKKLSRRRKRSY